MMSDEHLAKFYSLYAIQSTDVMTEYLKMSDNNKVQIWYLQVYVIR